MGKSYKERSNLPPVEWNDTEWIHESLGYKAPYEVYSQKHFDGQTKQAA